jgi:tetratricopeptide (TPR) repeat protein
MRILQWEVMTFVRIDLLKIWLLIVVLAVGVIGQRNGYTGTVLANLERSMELGKLAEVERGLFDYIIANPADANGFSLFARLRLKQDRLKEARSLAEKALTLDPSLLQAKVALAEGALLEGDAIRLRSVLAGVSENDVRDATTSLKLARLFASAGECPRAMQVTERLPIRIKNTDALPLRVRCSLESRNTKELTHLVTLARIQVRQKPAIAIESSELLFSGGLLNETVDLMSRVITVAPNNFDALLLLSRAKIALGQLPAARGHLAKAEKILPDSAELFFTWSLLETEEGKHKAAYELLERSLALNSNNRGTLAQYVVTALRVGQTGRAVKAAEKLLTLQPDDLEYTYLYGIAAIQTENVQQAEEALIRYVAARPLDSRGCLALGLAYSAQSGKLAAARQQMLNCLAIDPQNFEAAFQIGLSYKTDGDSAKAAEYFEKAVVLSPDYTAALRELGTVYMQSGTEERARPLLEKAARLNPNDAETHFQLSRLYTLLGENELGKKHLEIFQKLRAPKRGGM